MVISPTSHLPHPWYICTKLIAGERLSYKLIFNLTSLDIPCSLGAREYKTVLQVEQEYYNIVLLTRC